jgi:hypothetical protein
MRRSKPHIEDNRGQPDERPDITLSAELVDDVIAFLNLESGPHSSLCNSSWTEATSLLERIEEENGSNCPNPAAMKLSDIS